MTPREKETTNGNREQRPAAPAISLPKGGGAICGIGEKFATNPVTGTGSITVPIATSPGRSGFGPQLSLSYDSGAGNGPFGFGWNLSLPSITRKTDKGLPRYDDASESDVFILSGAEDPVPVLCDDGSRWSQARTVDGADYVIHRYRPRIEGLFARIERWTRKSDGDVHWRSISKDNILTLYGKDTDWRIADPEDRRRIFSWLICETRDDKGNAGKQRSRKRLERQGGTVEERRCLGGLEIYRKYGGTGLVEEIETLHLFEGQQRVLLVDDVLQTDNARLSTGPHYRSYQKRGFFSAIIERMFGRIYAERLKSYV